MFELHRNPASAATIAGMEEHARGTVLVVDDEPTIAEVVARYLERAGYRTRIAGDGPARSRPPRRSVPTSWCSI